MNKYTYKGPVKEFNTVINTCWSGETYAPTLAKARSNLVYQYKKQTGRSAGAKITLPGEIKKII